MFSFGKKNPKIIESYGRGFLLQYGTLKIIAYMREAGTARDSSAGVPQAAMRGGDL